MALRQVRFSDLTNKLIENDGELVRIVVEQHPALENGPVEIEAVKKEVEAVRKSALDVVSLKLFEGDGTEPEAITVEVDVFNKLATSMDMMDIIRRAEPAYPPRRKATTRASADKADYTSLDRAGIPHRGKVTDAEKQVVRDNLSAINERLERDNIRTIDLDNPEHVARYGLDGLTQDQDKG